jgi:predicted TIM-barrel fold metal-dependent hydrolase
VDIELGDNETIDDYWLISVDDHVIEPADVWQSRVPEKFKDAAPKMVTEGEDEFWHYDGKRIPTTGLSATAGRQASEFSPSPVRYADMRAGCYDSQARLEDMDRAGILASLCFPSFPRFCGQIFWEAEDKELAAICVRAYNDWMIDEWCGSAPGRYIPCIILPLWDPQAAAKEVERCAAKGAHALAFSENPYHLGLPTLFDANYYWDPVWAACQDNDVVVCMHVGSSSHIPEVSPDSPTLVNMAWMIGVRSSGALLTWIMSGVFKRFPHLKIALSEGGIGWIPYFVQRAQQVVDKQWAWGGDTTFRLNQAGTVRGEAIGYEFDVTGLDLREVVQKHVYGCFIDDPVGVMTLDFMGVDNVMAETDYPHSDSTWPDSILVMRDQLEHRSLEDRRKILRGNAERAFSFKAAQPSGLPGIVLERGATSGP